jgi:hypothetical protein
MGRREDELTGSAPRGTVAGPDLAAEPYTGPSTAAQFAALDVLRAIAARQRGAADAAEERAAGPESTPGVRPVGRNRVLALGRKTLAFLTIPGARSSPE